MINYKSFEWRQERNSQTCSKNGQVPKKLNVEILTTVIAVQWSGNKWQWQWKPNLQDV